MIAWPFKKNAQNLSQNLRYYSNANFIFLYINEIFIPDEQSVPLFFFKVTPIMKTCLISLKISLLQDTHRLA